MNEIESGYHPNCDELGSIDYLELMTKQLGSPATFDELVAVEQLGIVPIDSESINNLNLRQLFNTIKQLISNHDGSKDSADFIKSKLEELDVVVLDIDRAEGADKYVSSEARTIWNSKLGLSIN